MVNTRGGPTSECHLVEYVLFYIMVIMEHVMKKQNGVEENFQVVYTGKMHHTICIGVITFRTEERLYSPGFHDE